MKSSVVIVISSIVFLAVPTISQANSTKWNASVGVNLGNTNRPGYPQQPPNYPQNNYPPGYPPNRPFPPSRPPGNLYPNNGVSLTYQAPSYTTVNQQSYTWVNGDPNVAQIKSTNKIVITNWRELGLPAPPNGMYWIYEDGRYILESN